MFEKLFEPLKIRGMEVKNRIVLPAMGTKMAAEDGAVTQQIIDYQVARVKGGCGLNLSEVCAVHAPSAPRKFLALHNDSYIPSHKAFCDAIHEAGGKCGIQLWQGSLAASMDPKARILVASDLNVHGYTIPAVDVETIEEVVACFGAAAKRAVEAGYDCVEFHCGHNYLPHSFLSPAFNHREDAYGGTFEKRCKFPLDCIRAIRENIPQDMPLLMRLDAQDDYLENGLTIEDVIRYCKLAKEAGVDVLDISRGNMITAGLKYEVPPIDIPKGFNVDNCARIRKETGMLCIAVGRINTPFLAEEILEQDKADLVVMGRAQLADAQFCNKTKEGRLQDIVYCIGCDQGCYDGFTDPGVPFITCMRNPYLGKEAQDQLIPAQKPKRVLVAGGGVAGLEAACILKQRGHMPVVYEASDTLGGQFVTAGRAPRKEEMKAATQSYGEKAKRLGVEIHLQTPVTALLIADGSWDEVILAIGAEPIHLRISGADRPNVYNSHDILNKKVKAEGHVAVIGGGLVGVETAEFLSEQGCQVTVIEMMDAVAKDLGALRKICVMESLYMHHIETVVNTSLKAVSEHGILVEQEGCEKEIVCDSVVMAVGAKARDHEALVQACESKQLPYHIIGDAKQARRALQAIAEAHEIARQL